MKTDQSQSHSLQKETRQNWPFMTLYPRFEQGVVLVWSLIITQVIAKVTPCRSSSKSSRSLRAVLATTMYRSGNDIGCALASTGAMTPFSIKSPSSSFDKPETSARFLAEQMACSFSQIRSVPLIFISPPP
jgi:hypothetical protein